MTNHDLHMTRSSPQTLISPDNVHLLEVEWIFNNTDDEPIENSPLIVGNVVYSQDNRMRVRAFDIFNGSNLFWEFDPTLPEAAVVDNNAHGIAYFDGVLYVPTGTRGTLIALNATEGTVIWETRVLSTHPGFRIGSIPSVWQDYVIIGAALGDQPPNIEAAPFGSLRAINRTTGEQIWQIPLAIGNWTLNSANGGASSWSGGALDEETGIIYVPVGNAAPDFNTTTRSGIQLYANHLIAVNITDNGTVVWATPFLAAGTSLKTEATIPDVHDWDVSWGSILTQADFGNGPEKIVIGHDKLGDVMAMNASTGEPLWSITLGVNQNVNTTPGITANITDAPIVWPGTQGGVEAFAAADDSKVYVAISSSGVRFVFNGSEPMVVPALDDPGMANGLGNGSIVALNLTSGEIVWQYNTSAPTWVSPLVTNGIVFAGHVSKKGVGIPYEANQFGAPIGKTPIKAKGVLVALNATSGELLWKSKLPTPIGIGGPSISNGTLLVTTGSEDEVGSNTLGKVFAYTLPPSL